MLSGALMGEFKVKVDTIVRIRATGTRNKKGLKGGNV
jgi:hypothetical protein